MSRIKRQEDIKESADKLPGVWPNQPMSSQNITLSGRCVSSPRKDVGTCPNAFLLVIYSPTKTFHNNKHFDVRGLSKEKHNLRNLPSGFYDICLVLRPIE